MADRSKIEALLADLDELIPSATGTLPERTAEATRDLLADNDYFREMPSLAAYVKGQEDAAKLAAVRARLDSGKSYHLAEDIATIIEEQTNGR